MHVISVDFGSYSVKFVESNVERRKVTVFSLREIAIEQFRSEKEISIEESKLSVQMEIARRYLKDVSNDVKVIFNYPADKLTARHLTLPVKNKRKAELMIPFQLEEEIPFQAGDYHYASKLDVVGNNVEAFLSIAKTEDFQTFSNLYDQYNVNPSIVTSDISVIEHYFKTYHRDLTFMLLDIGHTTTKAYLFEGKKLISSHLSYIGGADIDDAISKSYNIDMEEAIIFKHRNSFFLTEGQYNEVEKNQKDFAILMDRLFASLINDINKWQLGFRVLTGIKLEHIFLTGGTSNIRNIENYLTQKTSVLTTHFDAFENTKMKNIDSDEKYQRKFSNASLISIAMTKRTNLVNFLTGLFSRRNEALLPLKSISFVGWRMAIILVLCLGYLFGEQYFLKRDDKLLTKRLVEILKKKELGISGRDQRSIIKSPEDVLRKLEFKVKNSKDELATFRELMKLDPFTPLVDFTKVVDSTKIALSRFLADEDGKISARFISESVKSLEALEVDLKTLNYKEIKTSLNPVSKELNVSIKTY